MRARRHEEKCQTIDKTMEELICQKATGQRRVMIIQLWKDKLVIREERTSIERLENTGFLEILPVKKPADTR